MRIARRYVSLELLVATILVAWCTSAHAQKPPAPSDKPVVGQALRYVNPLPLVTTSDDGSPRGVSLADVSRVS